MAIHNLTNSTRTSVRRAGLALSALAALLLSACGSGSGTPATTTATPATSPTPAITATAGPASIQATLTGDSGVTGPLVLGSVHFVTCDSPTLKGEAILAYENATDSTIGVLLTLRASTIEVRVARGSGTAYTERLFDGTGITAFNARIGARFSSSLTETTPSGASKGTLGSLSSISGSVSCGTFSPGSATVTVAGDTPGGTLSGALTSVRVLCGSTSAGSYATVSGLSKAGSTPVVVSLLGGLGAATFYVVVQTDTAGYQYSSATAGIVTLSNGTVTYNGTAKETAASTGAAGRSITVSGTATCGTNST